MRREGWVGHEERGRWGMRRGVGCLESKGLCYVLPSAVPV